MQKTIDEQRLIDDILRCSKETDGYLSNEDYRNLGSYSSKTLANRFGSWSNAKERAGLETRTANGWQPESIKTRKEKHQYLRQIREELGCVVCELSPKYPAIEFHHLPRYNKDKAISRMVSEHKSWKDIKEELRKCVTLCSNCHREIHAGVTTPPWSQNDGD
jgi:hypothetical protein